MCGMGTGDLLGTGTISGDVRALNSQHLCLMLIGVVGSRPVGTETRTGVLV